MPNISARRHAPTLKYLGALVGLYVVAVFSYLVVPITDRFGRVMLGSTLFSADGFLTAGILEWGYRSLFSTSHHFFDWNAGFPLSNTLAVTENLLGWQLLYTPLRAAGMGVIGAYNLLLLISLIISGIGAAMLGRRLGASELGAAAAGFVFAFGPFHLNHIIHIQTMAVCWAPLALLGLDRYLDRGRPIDLLWLALFFLVTALSAVPMGVFLAVALLVYAALCWSFRRFPFRWSQLAGLLLAGVALAIALSPIIIHYLQFTAANGRYRSSEDMLAGLSMELLSPLRTPSWQAVWSNTRLARPATGVWGSSWSPSFPGVVASGLAIVGLLRGKQTASSRPTVLMVSTMALLCFVLSLGPLLKVLGSGPVSFAHQLPMPGRIWLLLPGVRWPMRFFFFSWLMVALLSGLGLTLLSQLVERRWRALLGAALILLIAIEYRPASWLAGGSHFVPEPLALSDAYPFLAAEHDRGGVAELPIADADGSRVDRAVGYIYGSSGHLRRIIALWGANSPPLTDSLWRAADRLPDDAARRFLLSRGVTRLVVHRQLMGEERSAALMEAFRSRKYPLLFTGRESAVYALARNPDSLTGRSPLVRFGSRAPGPVGCRSSQSLECPPAADPGIALDSAPSRSEDLRY